MKRAIREHLRDFIAILILVAIAAGAAAIILPNQRFSFPFISEKPFTINAELQEAKSVTAGQGQTVQVAGVQIGRIGSVKLKDGRAIVKLELFRKYKDLVHSDARAELRPRTGLEDMYVQIDPGSHSKPVIKENATIPVARTLVPVELDQILAELDTDTRDYLQLLVNGAGQGLKGRANDLAETFRRFGPTARDLARVNQSVSGERVQLARVVDSLALLNGELAKRPRTLSQLVDASAATFRAFASEDVALTRSIGDLPGTLRQATRTLTTVRTFADQLGPTARALEPPARALTVSNRAVLPFAREATPILRKRIRPFVRESRPLVRDLRPAANDLAAATPKLTSSFVVLNHLFNMLGYNPGGRQGPEVASRQEGYLFWIAWLTHDTVNLFNVDDANGPLRPVYATFGCDTINALAPVVGPFIDINKVLVGLCGIAPPGKSPIDLLKIIQGVTSLLPGGGKLPPLPLPLSKSTTRSANPPATGASPAPGSAPGSPAPSAAAPSTGAGTSSAPGQGASTVPLPSTTPTPPPVVSGAAGAVAGAVTGKGGGR